MSPAPRFVNRGRWAASLVIACGLLAGAPTAHAADQPPLGGSLAGDFNGDGLMDFVANTTGTAAQSSHQVVFGSAGTGRAKTLEEGGQGVRLTLAGIQPATGAPVTFRPPVRIGDFDGDGYDDVTIDGFGGRSWIVFGGPSAGTVAVAEGDPRVTMLLDFTGPRSTGARTSFGVGDWNGDGFADFIQPRDVPATLAFGEYGASRGHGMIVFGGLGTGINTNGRARVRDLRNWTGGAQSIMGRENCGFFSNGWVPVYGCRVSFTWPIPIGDYDGDGKSDLYQPTGSMVLRGHAGQTTLRAMDRGYLTMDVPSQPEGNAWLPANDPARGTVHATYTCDLGGSEGKLGIRYTPDLPTTWPSGNASFGLTAELKFDAAAVAVLRSKNLNFYDGPLVVPVTLKNDAGAPVRVNVTVEVSSGSAATGRSPAFAAPVGSPSSLIVGGSLIGDLKGYSSSGGPIGWGTATDHDGDPTTSDLRCSGPEANVPRNGIVPRPTPGPTPAPGSTPTPSPSPTSTPTPMPSPSPTPTPTPTPTPAPTPGPTGTPTSGWYQESERVYRDGFLLLDGATANKVGFAYDHQRTVDANELRVDFDLTLGTVPGVAPGNGATLAFASALQGGVHWGGNPGIGLGWVTNKGNAIVFGTVKGGLTPSSNYVAIANGVVGKSGYPTLLQSAPAVTPLAGNTTHVTVRASGGIVTVALNGTERLRRVMTLPSDAWVGFTAATSTARQSVAVRNVVIGQP